MDKDKFLEEMTTRTAGLAPRFPKLYRKLVDEFGVHPCSSSCFYGRQFSPKEFAKKLNLTEVILAKYLMILEGAGLLKRFVLAKNKVGYLHLHSFTKLTGQEIEGIKTGRIVPPVENPLAG